MGQQQLAMALNARGLRAGATLVESVTERKAVETPQTDGSVKKESVFVFRGFRPIYQF